MIELVQDKPKEELKPSALKVLKLLLARPMTAVDFVNAHVLDYRKRVSELNAHYGPGTIISRKVAGHPYYRYELLDEAAICLRCGRETEYPAKVCEDCTRDESLENNDDAEYLAYKEGER